MAGLGNLSGLPSSFDHSAHQTPESRPRVAEIVESSTSKAHAFVQNEPTTTAGTDIMGIEKIEEAMDFVNNRRSGNGLATPSIRYSTLADLVHSSHNSQPNPSTGK
ncbi:hypothetical protein WN943_028581 [Citrus x changshan-huyou]